MPEPSRAPVPENAQLAADAVVQLARSDRAAARARLRGLSPQRLGQLCQELRPELRGEFLMLVEHPETVVPELDDTAIAITMRASGMSEAAWLLELATADQRRACLDLDCWSGGALEPRRALEWIDALIEAGRPTLVQAAAELDPELWQLALREMGEIFVLGREDEPPDGFATEDGVVYFRGRSDADFARLREVLQATFSEAQPQYWRLVYGMLFELPAELEEYALRWRNARLNDLGFPDREHAREVYRPLRMEEVAPLDLAPLAETGEGAERDTALVATAELPRQIRGTLLGQALSELPRERAADLLGYVLAVANAVAVADQLRLSEPESVPRALRKAVAGIDRGLRELAGTRAQPPATVLETTRPRDLFRIGATLDPDLRKS
jgi:hypothetical protein